MLKLAASSVANFTAFGHLGGGSHGCLIYSSDIDGTFFPNAWARLLYYGALNTLKP